MVQQKIRDNYSSTKKIRQYDNFKKKMNYLINKYPNNKVIGIMWFIDDSLKKNKKYYTSIMEKDTFYNSYLFYGKEFFNYLDKINIWNEFIEYMMKWKIEETYNIELNFEKNWDETKKELLENIQKSKWKKIIKNDELIKTVMPILFPTGKYKEILEIHKIKL